MTLYEIIEKFDDNRDGYLTDKEFTKILNFMNINNKQITDRILSRLFDKDNNNMISTTHFVLLIDYFYSFYNNKTYSNFGRENYFALSSEYYTIKEITEKKDQSNILDFKSKLAYKENNLDIKKKRLFKYLSKNPDILSISSKSNYVLTCVKDYEKISHKGFYSGAIIISKLFGNNEFYNKLMNIQRKIFNYVTLINKHAKNKITENFLKRIFGNDYIKTVNEINSGCKRNVLKAQEEELKHEDNKTDVSIFKSKLNKKITDVEIAEVKIFVFEEREMIDMKYINRSNLFIFI